MESHKILNQMLGFIISPNLPPPLVSPLSSSRFNPILPLLNTDFPSLSTTIQHHHFSHPKKFRINAQNGGGDKKNALPSEKGSNGDGGEVKNEPAKLNIKWVDLLLDRDPDNIAAVGLTGLLTWASVQVLWQLFMTSVAILIAAVKYSIVAALLIFILITLL